MKKLILILILTLTLPVLSEARMNLGIVGGGVAAGGGTDACATCPDGAAGGDVVCEDFEEGDDYLCSWTETIDTGDSIAGAAHSGSLACTNKGSKAIQVTTTGIDTTTYTQTDSGTAKDGTYVSFYINLVAEGMGDEGYITVMIASNTTDTLTKNFGVFAYQTSGVIYYALEYYNGSGYSTIIGTTAISTGTWYKVDAYYNHATTTVQLWVNGTSQGSASNTSASRPARYYSIGTNPTSSEATATYQVDIFKVDDDTRPAACPTS